MTALIPCSAGVTQVTGSNPPHITQNCSALENALECALEGGAIRPEGAFGGASAPASPQLEVPSTPVTLVTLGAQWISATLCPVTLLSPTLSPSNLEHTNQNSSTRVLENVLELDDFSLFQLLMGRNFEHMCSNFCKATLAQFRLVQHSPISSDWAFFCLMRQPNGISGVGILIP